jgi:glycerophosphoryl diester phosphodiesterase
LAEFGPRSHRSRPIGAPHPREGPLTSNPAVQAHRGSPAPEQGIAENTLAAFARAARLGADGVELDVRRTADGVLAVHHDPVLEGRGPVAELTVGDLPDHVPSLEAALDACGGLAVNIEIKNLPTEPGFDPDEGAARLVAELLVRRPTGPRMVVSSFWAPSLDVVRAVRPSTPTGLLLAGWADAGTGLAQAVGAGYQALHLQESLVTATGVEAAHRAGLAVAAWTVNGAAAVRAMAEAGVDTVITDDVEGAIAALTGPDRGGGDGSGSRHPTA